MGILVQQVASVVVQVIQVEVRIWAAMMDGRQGGVVVVMLLL